MMGCLCYLRKRKFVFFLVNDGIVIMKLSDKDQTVLKDKFGGKPFEMAGQTGRLWVTPLKSTKDLKLVMPFVRKRYQEALEGHATAGASQQLEHCGFDVHFFATVLTVDM